VIIAYHMLVIVSTFQCAISDTTSIENLTIKIFLIVTNF